MTADVSAVPGATALVTYRWRILIGALLVQVTISIVTLGLPALAPFAMRDLNLSTAEVGLFATVLNVGTMVALLPAGWAVDVLGERRVLVVGGIATGVVGAIASVVPGLVLLLPVLIIVGLAAATPTPAGSTAIMSAFALKDRGFVISVPNRQACRSAGRWPPSYCPRSPSRSAGVMRCSSRPRSQSLAPRSHGCSCAVSPHAGTRQSGNHADRWALSSPATLPLPGWLLSP